MDQSPLKVKLRIVGKVLLYLLLSHLDHLSYEISHSHVVKFFRSLKVRSIVILPRNILDMLEKLNFFIETITRPVTAELLSRPI